MAANRLHQALLTTAWLLSSPAYASSLQVMVHTPEGDPLPGARVNLLALSEDGQECEVVEQTVADELGKAVLVQARPGVHMVAVELAGFLGTEIGPFRIEGGRDSRSEAPAVLSVVLNTGCPICVNRPAVNSYLLARRCGADDPAQEHSK